MEYSLTFDPNRYTEQTITVDGREIRYRAYENIIYVRRPVDIRYQCMNIYVPEGVGQGDDVPVFFRNYVGGYTSVEPWKPGLGEGFVGVGLAHALAHGMVAVSPGARGRDDRLNGRYTGKAPAGIVDLKAAIRYLRYNAQRVPGNMEHIISDGTSAGGALSALLGVTGNSPAYEPYLRDLGAAEARDDVFGAVCFCPIADLEHANAAYEWQFGSIHDFFTMKPRRENGEFKVDRVDIHLSEQEIRMSDRFAAYFCRYVNALQLVDPETGAALTLDPETGRGPYFDYMLEKIGASATEYLAGCTDDERKEQLARWQSLTWDPEQGSAQVRDYEAYIAQVSRMKTCPAFDAFDLSGRENGLFGSETDDTSHFDDTLEALTGIPGNTSSRTGRGAPFA